MKLYKKVLIIFSCLFITGCFGLQSSRNKKTITVGLVADIKGNVFIEEVLGVVERQAKRLGVHLLIQDSLGKQPWQDKYVTQMLNIDVDALIIDLVDISAALSLIQKAKEKNVPIVFMNDEPEKSALGTWAQAYFVGFRASEIGKESVGTLIDYFKNHRENLKNDGIIRYVVFTGDTYHSSTMYHTNAYEQAFASSREKGDMGGEKLMEVCAMWNRDMAKTKMTEMLSIYHERIEAILAHNDAMALGAIDALKEVGYFKTGGGFIPVIGVNGSPLGIDAIAQGNLLATIRGSAVNMGYDAINMAVALATKTDPNRDLSVPLTTALGTPGNRKTARYVWIPVKPITADNYRLFYRPKK